MLRRHPNPYPGQEEHGLPLHQQELTPKLEAFKSTTSSFDPIQPKPRLQTPQFPGRLPPGAGVLRDATAAGEVGGREGNGGQLFPTCSHAGRPGASPPSNPSTAGLVFRPPFLKGCCGAWSAAGAESLRRSGPPPARPFPGDASRQGPSPLRGAELSTRRSGTEPGTSGSAAAGARGSWSRAPLPPAAPGGASRRAPGQRRCRKGGGGGRCRYSPRRRARTGRAPVAR